jgi:hypothetical protein
MSLEETLASWTAPSSDTEQDKQERTERMIREAISAHPSLQSCSTRVFAKGSYANNTNVRADSDVDIAVECKEAEYWDEAQTGLYVPRAPYSGEWTPSRFRAEVERALSIALPGQIDVSGTTAIVVRPTTSRVYADVVPCFSYRYHLIGGSSRVGTKIFKRDGSAVVNYPDQQLEYGTAKNARTGYAYKKTVRILKRVENAMSERRLIAELPSYFVECLVFNCPDAIFDAADWQSVVRQCLQHIWTSLQGGEPEEEASRWREANNSLYLFTPSQKWTRETGRNFAKAAWNYLGFTV